MFKTEYAAKVYAELEKKNPGEKEFLQAAREITESLEGYIAKNPKLQQQKILERFLEPERFVQFKVVWVDDKGEFQVNRGFRVQYNSAIGPYKGGLRLHPSVNASIIKFLGLEQVLKNSLTTLPMGGGKGGSDFDPKGKSDNEVMRFCQSFMTELYRHIGPDTDVPAGDIGVGAREIGYLFGQYKRIRDEFSGVLTGKGLTYGGSLARTQATGYGLCYYAQEALKALKNTSFEGKTVVISGSGNVAIYTCEKATQLGGKVVALSDSNGYVVVKDGITPEILAEVKKIKEVERGRIKELAARCKGVEYHETTATDRIWNTKCDIALPCATQNELLMKDAETLVKNGCIAVCEGANMPTELEAAKYLIAQKLVFTPAKASNAGGVATSGLEMSQNSERLSWTFEEVDEKLHGIMVNIFNASYKEACEAGNPFDLLAGANIAGFKKVAEAMIAQGI
ncbi:MAG: NADP-specific glutamate dehydrogenase [Acholeplasmatales bacterium]|nr:NADP-specific glutamate dehydrogenase [Acholeplasmatales bacterium]